MPNQLCRISTLLIALCFVLFSSASAVEENKSIHISEIATSYLGKIQDNEIILSLDNLIYIALKNNQMIKVIEQRQAQGKGQLTQAKSGYLPHLTLEGSYNYTERQNSAAKNRDETIPSDAEEIVAALDEVEEDDVLHGAARLSQLIYDFGKTTGAIGVGRSNLKAEDANLQRQIQNIIFEVKKAYHSVLEKRRLIDVASESVKSFQQHLERAKVYHKAGVRTRFDVINAEVELSNSNMELLRAEYSLKKARVELEQILGIKPNQGRYTLYNDEVNIDNIIETMPPVPNTLQNLLQVAIEQRPDITQLKQITESAEANLVRVKGDYWPSFFAEANYNDYDTDLSLYKDSWEVGVAATWQLFSGLQTKGAIAEAQGRMRENIAQLQDLQLTIVKEVTDSYLQTDENRESVQIALQTLELAKENLQLAKKRYQSGAYDVIEFNDAQLRLTKTRNELVVTYYGYLTALASIEHATGSYSKEEQNIAAYSLNISATF